MSQVIKNKVTTTPWSLKLRPRVGDTVSESGSDYQNISGRNSQPSLNPQDWKSTSIISKAYVDSQDQITLNSSKAYTDSKTPSGGAQLVYFNFTDPNLPGATIFDLNNPPVTNNNALKNNVDYLYVGIDSSTWVYKTSPAGYTTKPMTNNLLNQIEIYGNNTSQLHWNGKEVTAMSSGTHTVGSPTIGGVVTPLPDQFSYDLACDTGATLTWAIGSGYTFRVAGQASGTPPPTMLEGQFCTVSKRIGTNEIRVRGLT